MKLKDIRRVTGWKRSELAHFVDLRGQKHATSVK